MTEESVYKMIELVGTSKVSWEEASRNAIEIASKNYSDMRVAEVTRMDMTIELNAVAKFRVRLKVSYRYHLD